MAPNRAQTQHTTAHHQCAPHLRPPQPHALELAQVQQLAAGCLSTDNLAAAAAVAEGRLTGYSCCSSCCHPLQADLSALQAHCTTPSRLQPRTSALHSPTLLNWRRYSCRLRSPARIQGPQMGYSSAGPASTALLLSTTDTPKEPITCTRRLWG